MHKGTGQDHILLIAIRHYSNPNNTIMLRPGGRTWLSVLTTLIFAGGGGCFPWCNVPVQQKLLLLRQPSTYRTSAHHRGSEGRLTFVSSQTWCFDKSLEEDELGDAEEEEEEDHHPYHDLTNEELIQRSIDMIGERCQQQLKTASREISPLERAIMEENKLPDPSQEHVFIAEEMIKAFQVLRSSLTVQYLDLDDRCNAVAEMAEDILEVSGQVMGQRQQNDNPSLSNTRSGRERLEHALQRLEEAVGMTRARRMADHITDKQDEVSKNLKVGHPQLPPWATSIGKGANVEYFWNEEYGWCRGEVIEEPTKIVDEILLTVRFDDGETHVLPLSAEDKIRWRPPS